MRLLGLAALALVLLLGGGLVLMLWFLDVLDVTPEGQGVQTAPVMADPPRPPEPPLQASPRQDMQNMLAAENARLQSYAWVDERAGIARIPLARALELVVEQGLPTWPDESGHATQEPSPAQPDTNHGGRQMSLRPYRLLMALGLVTVLSVPPAARAHHHAQHTPPMLQHVDFEQRLQAFIPLDLVFRDETGLAVPLGQYFGTTPVILTLVYYDCPNLCTLVLNGLLRTLRALSLTLGDDFQVLTVSIDPQDTPALAAAKRTQYLRAYGHTQAADGWHFLTGTPAATQALTQAVGFRYTYDASRDEFAHASGIMVLTPQGQLARYFYGVEYAPRHVRLGLVEAAAQKIGSPIDQILLLCYHYDPASGTYTPAIIRLLRVAGVATILAVGTFMGTMIHRERRHKARRVERK